MVYSQCISWINETDSTNENHMTVLQRHNFMDAKQFHEEDEVSCTMKYVHLNLWIHERLFCPNYHVCVLYVYATPETNRDVNTFFDSSPKFSGY